jgi:thioredoxin reductase
MPQPTDVAIVGAGPYGLSIAAHLAQLKVPFRIFGKPMETWLDHMPRGMHLKSDGFASRIYHPEGRLTLGEYCRERTLPYADTGIPVRLETFCQYGLEFQRRFVPTLEQKLVTDLKGGALGFTMTLDTGETVAARRVVVATGVSNFHYLPPSIEGLRGFVSHSSEHSDLTTFKGRDIIVLGRGASAVDMAVLLQQAGANVRLVARKPTLGLNKPPSLKQRLFKPQTGLGPSWKSWFFSNHATAFHHLPSGTRLKCVQSHLGPAGCWFMAERITRVPQLLGRTPVDAKVIGGRVRLELAMDEGRRRQIIEADHVIAATGYRPRLDRLTFMSPDLSASIRLLAGTPVLSTRFESNVPNLYFVGPIAANSFGPLMRFAFGADYAARRLSPHLALGSARYYEPRVEDVDRGAAGNLAHVVPADGQR